MLKHPWTDEDMNLLVGRALGLWNEWSEFADGFIDQARTEADLELRKTATKAVMIAACNVGSDYVGLPLKKQMQMAGMVSAMVQHIMELESEAEAQKMVEALVNGTLGDG